MSNLWYVFDFYLLMNMKKNPAKVIYMITLKVNKIEESKILNLKTWIKQEIISLKKKAKWIVSKKYKNIFMALSYIEQLLILLSTVTVCVSISAFVSVAGICMDLDSSAVELKIRVITVKIKKYKLINKKKRN